MPSTTAAFSLAFLDGSQFRWARLSPGTYAEVEDEVGVPLEFVLAFEEALGKVRPAPDDPAPSDLGGCSRPARGDEGGGDPKAMASPVEVYEARPSTARR